jgi:hypothetical protein
MRDVGAVLKSWGNRQAGRAFRRWHSQASLSRQRDQHVEEALQILRNKSLEQTVATTNKLAVQAKTRAMSKVWKGNDWVL